ncbi:MAG: ATP-binding cassette domain-containing protein [Dehalococcoidia bacterium]
MAIASPDRSMAARTATAPVRIDARELRTVLHKRRTDLVLLHDISLTILPGELVTIVGGSGAGKSTLINALAGVRPSTSGAVLYNGNDLAANIAAYRTSLGYVPQDDIVHKELTVARTLDYAARLRLCHATSAERHEAVKDVMVSLGLSEQSGQRVSSLSGGQRKRTSIGAELITHPGVFFLDEPTSGLDPATGREMMRLLRELADGGSTVVLTTHAPQDIAFCDRVVFLARGGHLVFDGTPAHALSYFGVEQFDAIYECLEQELDPAQWAERWEDARPRAAGEVPVVAAPVARKGPGRVRQWAVLTERNFEILGRNWLTLAILAGAPVLVIAMMTVLFRPGAFDINDPSPSATIMILYWVAFGSFFFGLTYGLLQIVTEMHIFQRERLVNLHVAPYVLSKVAVLAPILIVVNFAMIGVLRATDRLPSEGMDVYGPITITLLLDGLAAIALGLFASAAVTRPEQATLVLPLLCFPQVLFAGAMLPVPVMADVGEGISLFISDKWAFEALGKHLDLNTLFSEGNSPLGRPLLDQYEGTFSGGVAGDWAVLAAFTVAALVGTWVVLIRKSGTGR